MALFDLFKLRPADTSAAALQRSVELAATALTEHNAEVARLLEGRDALLLDGTAAAIKAADTALTTAREHGEKMTAVHQQLAQRLAAALETEKVAAVAAARVEAEAAAEALSKWWIGMRKKLAADLAEGMRLKDASWNSYYSHDAQRRSGQQHYPNLTFPDARQPLVEASGWPQELASAARLADSIKGVFDGLATACDPRPPGTF